MGADCCQLFPRVSSEHQKPPMVYSTILSLTLETCMCGRQDGIMKVSEHLSAAWRCKYAQTSASLRMAWCLYTFKQHNDPKKPKVWGNSSAVSRVDDNCLWTPGLVVCFPDFICLCRSSTVHLLLWYPGYLSQLAFYPWSNTFSTVQQWFWRPTLCEDVAELISACLFCGQTNCTAVLCSIRPLARPFSGTDGGTGE